LARKWPAIEKWSTTSEKGSKEVGGGWDHLEKLFGDVELEAYKEAKHSLGMFSGMKKFFKSRIWSFGEKEYEP